MQKYGKSNTQNEIFFEVFLEGIGFQWDGDGVFIQAEAIGAGQRALWGGRKRPGTGRRRGHGGIGMPG